MAEQKVTGVKGMNDVRPRASEAFLDSAVWRRIFAAAEEVGGAYGYQMVYLPLVEETALFHRGLGEDTDVVSKEMYTMTDRGGRHLALRPEGTAGAARAYIEHHLGRNEPQQKWLYMGPMFRAERPQKGRYRQFYQIGAECFGLAGPGADVELLQMLTALCQRLGLPAVQTRLNTLGDEATRAQFRLALGSFLQAHAEALCATCQQRSLHNPLRVLDCKNPQCQSVLRDAPDILSCASDSSRAWFEQYLRLLDALHLPYVRDKHLVRGLDYYSEAIFEMTTDALGAQDAILGGGRYDGLVPMLGGPPTPAVGFAAGVERLALLLTQQQQEAVGPHLFLSVLDEQALAPALALAAALRAEGCWQIEVATDVGRVKQSIKRADKLRAQAFAALGAQEIRGGQLTLKEMAGGMQQTVACTAQAVAAWLQGLGTGGAV